MGKQPSVVPPPPRTHDRPVAVSCRILKPGPNTNTALLVKTSALSRAPSSPSRTPSAAASHGSGACRIEASSQHHRHPRSINPRHHRLQQHRQRSQQHQRRLSARGRSRIPTLRRLRRPRPSSHRLRARSCLQPTLGERPPPGPTSPRPPPPKPPRPPQSRPEHHPLQATDTAGSHSSSRPLQTPRQLPKAVLRRQLFLSRKAGTPPSRLPLPLGLVTPPTPSSRPPQQLPHLQPPRAHL